MALDNIDTCTKMKFYNREKLEKINNKLWFERYCNKCENQWHVITIIFNYKNVNNHKTQF